MRNLRSTSKLAPLTPSIPEPSATKPVEHPVDWPSDAAVIYRELLWWRDRALAAEKLYHAECKRFTKFRAKGIARAIAKKLTPSHDPEASQ